MTSFVPNGHMENNGHADPTGPDPVIAAKIHSLYTSAGQGHVFTFYDSLSPPEQTTLLKQLAEIDVNRVNRIYHNAVAADKAFTPPTHTIQLDDTLTPGGRMIGRSRSPSPGSTSEEVLPLPEAACASILNNPEEEARWRQIGLQAVSENQVAVLLMAGGQGTRLGSTLPKGMYDIGLASGLSLFQLQASRLKRLEKLAEREFGKPAGSVSIRWYVMTSGPTREDTEEYFEKMGYFGLQRDSVVFFEQGQSKHCYHFALTTAR